jgi:hypothetical protein
VLAIVYIGSGDSPHILRRKIEFRCKSVTQRYTERVSFRQSIGF